METKKDTMKLLAQKSKKKKMVIIAVILVIALVLGIVFLNSRASMTANATDMSAIATDEVAIRSLIKSVGATGTVISVNARDLTASLANVEIKDVYVSEGDVVREGDPLIAFDTEDIEDNLESAQKSLGTTQQKNSITAQEDNRKVNDAQRTESYQIETAQAKLDSAYNEYIRTRDDYNKANDTLNSLKNNENAAYNDYKAKLDALEAAQKKLPTVSSGDYSAADQEVKTAKTLCDTAESFYNAQKTAREQQSSQVSSYATQYNNAYLSYESAIRDYNNTVAAQASNVTSAVNSQKSNSIVSNTDTDKTKVKQYEQQLEKGVLTAPFGGTITAVNFEAGDTYTAGTLVRLQDCTAYEIEAEISEYDISDIRLGQRVLIKTNATGSEELEGEVIFISPTATQSAAIQSAASSDVTYTVRIALNTQNERLRLDMTASLSIIIESHDSVYTVPYNALNQDDDGNYFISEVGEDGITIREIPVNMIMESNYYTEIESPEIYDGQKIRLNETAEESTGLRMMFGGGGGGF